MNRLHYHLMNEQRFGSIIPGHDSKKKKNPGKQHKKDDAIEEYVDEEEDDKYPKKKKDKEKGGEGMGRSDKAKNQHSDESDAADQSEH